CELAQSMYYYVFDAYTETILPFADTSADSMTAILVGLSAFSALSGFIGLPVAVLAAIVTVLISWAIEGSIANFTNWLWSIRDEYICTLYLYYPDYAAAAAAVSALIDAQDSISYLDRSLAKGFMASAWHMTWTALEQQTNGTWDTRFVTDQCDTCALPDPVCLDIGECDLSDWVGGVVACVDGLATIKGSLSVWQSDTLVPPNNSTLFVRFVPKSESATHAATQFGLTRASDSVHYNVIAETSNPVDVFITVSAPVPSALWGVACKLDMKQVVHWGSPLWWCIYTP
ncbi:MAG: hypothetical protein V3S69_07265, partial [Dehalococcoidales bacterium]